MKIPAQESAKEIDRRVNFKLTLDHSYPPQ